MGANSKHMVGSAYAAKVTLSLMQTGFGHKAEPNEARGPAEDRTNAT